MENDVRFTVPLFTPREAARHLGMPRSTLNVWLTNEAGPAPLVHRINPDVRNGSSVPFIAMIEAHVLRGLRELGLTP
jgi:hypothetical protein